MNCLIWNIRGLGKPENQSFLEDLRQVHKSKIVSIIEPMIQLDVRYMTRKFNFCQVLSNCTGKIWVFLSEEISFEVLVDHSQFLHLNFTAPFLPTDVFSSFVYASCDSSERKDLWESLLQVRPPAAPWLVGGDFNVVRSVNECLGSSGGRIDSSLLDPGFVTVEHLVLFISDHCLLMVSAPTGIRGPSSFRFHHMWTRHPGFLQTVRINWNLPCDLRGMHKLFAKLKRLKLHLKWWNKEVFGNLFEKLAATEKVVHDDEAAVLINPSNTSWAHFSACNPSLEKISEMELDFWKQKAACSWLADG
ncbi:uncharacterized protein [Henckelia pumila]|uniref:uncharacterized protein n=1 Tax=Henckelia pumila TaxID=405737 RepID=UPI003C6E71D5